MLACAALLAPVSVAQAAEKFATSSVSAQIDRSYARKKQADGSFRPEYYAISYGGQVQGTTSDKSIDGVDAGRFSELLKTHLAEQNFFLAPDSKSAQLLLYVNWGRTIPFNDLNYQQQLNVAGQSLTALKSSGAQLNSGFGLPSLSPEQQAAADQLEGDLLAMMMENQARDRANVSNARLLGYIDEINEVDDIARWAGGGTYYDDLRTDIEESRYYILIWAYDFRLLVEKKERKPLWVTRISMRAQGKHFERNLEGLIARASQFAGRDSRGLIRSFEGRVEIGEAEVLGIDESAETPATVDEPPPR